MKKAIICASALAALVVLASPDGLLACPNCFGSSSEGVLKAYFASFLIMSSLPLSMLAGFGYWLYRNWKKSKFVSDDAQEAR